MKWLVLGSVCFLFLGVAFLPVLAQDGDETPPPPKEGDGGEEAAPEPLDEEAKAYAKEFKSSYKKQSSADLIASVDKLAEYFLNPRVLDGKVKDELLDCLGSLQGHPDKTVVAHLMRKCAVLGEETLKYVLAVLNRELKAKIPDDKVCEAAMETIGKLKSENAAVVKLLSDLLKNKDDSTIARAAYTISMYEGASGRVRKDFFEEVLKNSEGVFSKQQGGDEAMKRKWTIIGDDMVLALNKLSLPPRKAADFSNPTEARKWFNEHKKANWDKQD